MNIGKSQIISELNFYAVSAKKQLTLQDHFWESFI